MHYKELTKINEDISLFIVSFIVTVNDNKVIVFDIFNFLMLFLLSGFFFPSFILKTVIFKTILIKSFLKL